MSCHSRFMNHDQSILSCQEKILSLFCEKSSTEYGGKRLAVDNYRQV